MMQAVPFTDLCMAVLLQWNGRETRGNSTDLAPAISRPFLFIRGSFSYSVNAPRQKVKHWLIKTGVKKQINESFGNRSGWCRTKSTNDKEYDIRRGQDSLPALDLSLYNGWADAYLQWEQAEEVAFVTGPSTPVYPQQQHCRTGIYPLIPNYTLLNPAVYISYWVKWKNMIGKPVAGLKVTT